MTTGRINQVSFSARHKPCDRLCLAQTSTSRKPRALQLPTATRTYSPNKSKNKRRHDTAANEHKPVCHQSVIAVKNAGLTAPRLDRFTPDAL